MGVYINMEMPKGRPVCIVIDAAVQARRYDLNNDRYTDDKLFEAISVQPHGRLGDLDKLGNDLRHMAKYQHGERQQGILGCCEIIRLAPTIIPAEEGE